MANVTKGVTHLNPVITFAMDVIYQMAQPVFPKEFFLPHLTRHSKKLRSDIDLVMFVFNKFGYTLSHDCEQVLGRVSFYGHTKPLIEVKTRDFFVTFGVGSKHYLRDQFFIVKERGLKTA